jgi:hypothetical protein
MEDERGSGMQHTLMARVGLAVKGVWPAVERSFDFVADTLDEYARLMRRESELFFGAAFLCIGLLNFQNGKNCDGNTAEYLTCTHPSTFFYYGWLEVTLVVIGVFLILIWFLKRGEEKKQRPARRTRAVG